MQQPPGIEDGTSSVLVLKKRLYGLKQAPPVWHQTVPAHLFALGCVQSPSYGALFRLRSEGQGDVYILLYVDDIQIASKLLSQVIAFKQAFLAKISGRDLGETR
jgi:hypothetical protein